MSPNVDSGPVRWRHLLQELAVVAGCVGMSLAFAVVPEPEPEPPPDFSVLETRERKRAFFDFLQPLVADVNARARADRDFVAHVAALGRAGKPLSRYERHRLDAVALRYEMEHPESVADLDRLHRRTGAVPPSLVLVQAAKESGWGTSRFATEGNNLFGQRCYEEGCGLTPLERAGTSSWGVARYATVRESLESYVRNLNTHPTYREFRLRRQELREGGLVPSGLELAATLGAYSERGDDYVAEVQSMIRQNELE